MGFLLLILVAILLYINGYRISAIIIIFFFLTEGFNMIPEEYFETGMGFSKGRDFAFFILFGIITIDAILKRGFFKIDTLAKYLIVFYVFLALCILNSRYSVGLSWNEIIRTIRTQFFWMLYFVFRSLSEEDMKKILNICFYVTIFTSVLYMLQLVVEDFILAGNMVSESTVFGITFYRFYNQPDFVYFMAFLAIYHNPIKGSFRYVATAIIVVAAMLAFHRSWIAVFILAMFIGYVISQSRIRKIKIVTVSLCILIPIAVFAGSRFVKSRTFFDINVVLQGNILEADLDIEDLYKSTFTYRMAHLAERSLYLSENPRARIIGAGLVPEDSRKIDDMFDFKIGLIDELTGNTMQIDTGDISYSLLFLHFGYVGTVIYMAIFIYLLYYFYKHRHNKYALVSFMYLILVLGVSFFSDILLRFANISLILLLYCLVKKQEDIREETEDERRETLDERIDDEEILIS